MKLKNLMAAAAACFPAACTLPLPGYALEPVENTQSAVMSAPDFKRIWRLEELNGVGREQLHALGAQLDLTALPHGRADFGCNILSFQADLAQNSAQFGAVAATRMYCAEAVAAESAFAAALTQVSGYRSDGGSLLLTDRHGSVLMRLLVQNKD